MQILTRVTPKMQHIVSATEKLLRSPIVLLYF